MVIVLMENLFICFEFKDSDYVFWDLCRRKHLSWWMWKGSIYFFIPYYLPPFCFQYSITLQLKVARHIFSMEEMLMECMVIIGGFGQSECVHW